MRNYTVEEMIQKLIALDVTSDALKGSKYITLVAQEASKIVFNTYDETLIVHGF